MQLCAPFASLLSKLGIRLGEPRAIQELWDLHDKSFLAIDFESWERNAASVLEWGYATVRCGHLGLLRTLGRSYADRADFNGVLSV